MTGILLIPAVVILLFKVGEVFIQNLGTGAEQVTIVLPVPFSPRPFTRT